MTAPDPERIRAFVAAIRASETPRAEQDADIVEVLFLTGLRRSELARLRVEDLRVGDLQVWVEGKSKNEHLPVSAEAMAVLERMAKRAGTGPLVHGGAGEITLRLQRRSKATGINLSPHALRRSFVTCLIRSGVDVATVSRYSRHSTSEVERYLAPREDAARVLAAVTMKRPEPEPDEPAEGAVPAPARRVTLRKVQ